MKALTLVREIALGRRTYKSWNAPPSSRQNFQCIYVRSEYGTPTRP